MYSSLDKSIQRKALALLAGAVLLATACGDSDANLEFASEASRSSTPAAQALPAQPLGKSGASGEASSQITNRMVVHNANIALDVKNVSDSIAEVRGLTEGVGGFVAGSSSRYKEDEEYASLTLRVPSSAYNQVMDGLRQMAVKVTSENGTARDVTEEYTDLDAQLRNLQATEAQYLALMKRANTIDEILQVQNHLTQVRSQIERFQGRMNLLERTTDMATIVVSLAPATAGRTRPPNGGWDPIATIQDAWEESLVVVQLVLDGALRLVVFFWWLIPPALIAWAVVALRRSRRAPPAEPQQQQ